MDERRQQTARFHVDERCQLRGVILQVYAEHTVMPERHVTSLLVDMEDLGVTHAVVIYQAHTVVPLRMPNLEVEFISTDRKTSTGVRIRDHDHVFKGCDRTFVHGTSDEAAIVRDARVGRTSVPVPTVTFLSGHY